MKTITYRRAAQRKLGKLPANEREKIVLKINQYAENPESLTNNVIKMQGEAHYRLRIGDWRVVFDEFDTVIDVIKIGSRGSIY